MNFFKPTSSIMLFQVNWNNIQDSNKVKWCSEVVQKSSTYGIYAFPKRGIAAGLYTVISKNKIAVPITQTIPLDTYQNYPYLVYADAQNAYGGYIYNFITKVYAENNIAYVEYEVDPAQTFNGLYLLQSYYNPISSEQATITPSISELSAGQAVDIKFNAEFKDTYHYSSLAKFELNGSYTDITISPDGVLSIGANSTAGDVQVIATDLGVVNGKTVTATITLT